jgi:hypothetical protein
VAVESGDLPELDITGIASRRLRYPATAVSECAIFAQQAEIDKGAIGRAAGNSQSLGP